MSTRGGKVHVATTRRHYNGKTYETHLLRRTFRQGGKVHNETVGNLSHLPLETIDVIRRSLAGETFFSSADLVLRRSQDHGNVVVVLGLLRQLGLDKIIDPTHSRQRDLCVGMVVARLLRLGSKLATTRQWNNSTLPSVLGIENADEDELYAAMDWLVKRQAKIEARLAKRHLAHDALVLYDLSSTYMEGRHCSLAKIGYSRDGKKGTLQIEYGLISDQEGRPVAVEVVEGNTSDPATVPGAVRKLKDRFGLREVVLVGDRGMLTSARIEALKQDGLGWVSSLRSPQIRKLVDGGDLQLSIFDEMNLAEITHPDYPGERLVVCKNPLLATERARKREDLLLATEKKLAPVLAAVEAGRLRGAADIGIRVGKVKDHYNVGKHFDIQITKSSLRIARKQDEITSEAALDGIYVVRTSVTTDRLDSAGVVRAYKRLVKVERVFRGFKSIDIAVRPVHHRAPDRVRAHIFLCMLAYYVQWHLERAWASLLFRDQQTPVNDDPVAKAHRSDKALEKASTQQLQDGSPVHSLRTLLDHMRTLSRDTMSASSDAAATTFKVIGQPTPLQARALALLSLKPTSL